MNIINITTHALYSHSYAYTVTSHLLGLHDLDNQSHENIAEEQQSWKDIESEWNEPNHGRKKLHATKYDEDYEINSDYWIHGKLIGISKGCIYNFLNVYQIVPQTDFTIELPHLSLNIETYVAN